MFGMPRSDRGRHLYIIGQTGVGKVWFAGALTISDVFSPTVLRSLIPTAITPELRQTYPGRARQRRHFTFNPADTDFSIAFNPQECKILSCERTPRRN